MNYFEPTTVLRPVLFCKGEASRHRERRITPPSDWRRLQQLWANTTTTTTCTWIRELQVLKGQLLNKIKMAYTKTTQPLKTLVGKNLVRQRTLRRQWSLAFGKTSNCAHASIVRPGGCGRGEGGAKDVDRICTELHRASDTDVDKPAKTGQPKCHGRMNPHSCLAQELSSDCA